MKVRVKIAGKIFDVEIDTLHTQPVIARVDGEPIEVWLESAPGEDYFCGCQSRRHCGVRAGAVRPGRDEDEKSYSLATGRRDRGSFYYGWSNGQA
jgi:hypothetical protein